MSVLSPGKLGWTTDRQTSILKGCLSLSVPTQPRHPNPVCANVGLHISGKSRELGPAMRARGWSSIPDTGWVASLALALACEGFQLGGSPARGLSSVRSSLRERTGGRLCRFPGAGALAVTRTGPPGYRTTRRRAACAAPRACCRGRGCPGASGRRRSRRTGRRRRPPSLPRPP